MDFQKGKLPLEHIICQFGSISYHCYADDVQLPVFVKPGELSNLSILHSCLNKISTWMSQATLQHVLLLFVVFCLCNCFLVCEALPNLVFKSAM